MILNYCAANLGNSHQNSGELNITKLCSQHFADEWINFDRLLTNGLGGLIRTHLQRFNVEQQNFRHSVRSIICIKLLPVVYTQNI